MYVCIHVCLYPLGIRKVGTKNSFGVYVCARIETRAFCLLGKSFSIKPYSYSLKKVSSFFSINFLSEQKFSFCHIKYWLTNKHQALLYSIKKTKQQHQQKTRFHNNEGWEFQIKFREVVISSEDLLKWSLLKAVLDYCMWWGIQCSWVAFANVLMPFVKIALSWPDHFQRPYYLLVG